MIRRADRPPILPGSRWRPQRPRPWRSPDNPWDVRPGSRRQRCGRTRPFPDVPGRRGVARGRLLPPGCQCTGRGKPARGGPGRRHRCRGCSRVRLPPDRDLRPCTRFGRGPDRREASLLCRRGCRFTRREGAVRPAPRTGCGPPVSAGPAAGAGRLAKASGPAACLWTGSPAGAAVAGAGSRTPRSGATGLSGRGAPPSVSGCLAMAPAAGAAAGRTVTGAGAVCSGRPRGHPCGWPGWLGRPGRARKAFRHRLIGHGERLRGRRMHRLGAAYRGT